MEKINQKFDAKLYALYDMSRLALFGHARTKKSHILVACMPKSGSTFLTSTLGYLPSFSNVSLISGGGRREHELEYLNLFYFNRINYIAQQHVKFSRSLEKKINEFSLRPIVLTRNIFDIIISLRDHIRTESLIGPMTFIPYSAAEWSDEKLEIFLARTCIPWYLSFYLSWQECREKIMINYTDFVNDPITIINKICNYADIEVDRKQIKLIIEKGSNSFTRKNKGIDGRGDNIHPKARDHIIEIASYYNEYDLKSIGLG